MHHYEPLCFNLCASVLFTSAAYQIGYCFRTWCTELTIPRFVSIELLTDLTIKFKETRKQSKVCKGEVAHHKAVEEDKGQQQGVAQRPAIIRNKTSRYCMKYWFFTRNTELYRIFRYNDVLFYSGR